MRTARSLPGAILVPVRHAAIGPAPVAAPRFGMSGRLSGRDVCITVPSALGNQLQRMRSSNCRGLRPARKRQRLHTRAVFGADLSLQQACERLSECQELQVHILMVPLVGLEIPAKAAMPLWEAFSGPNKRDPLALHSIVVLSSNTFALATDFLPVEPLAPMTALQLLQGKTPGKVRLRQLSRLPSRQTFEVAKVPAQQVPTPCIHTSLAEASHLANR